MRSRQNVNHVYTALTALDGPLPRAGAPLSMRSWGFASLSGLDGRYVAAVAPPWSPRFHEVFVARRSSLRGTPIVARTPLYREPHRCTESHRYAEAHRCADPIVARVPSFRENPS